jgi:flagellin-specific chaperone FliS
MNKNIYKKLQDAVNKVIAVLDNESIVSPYRNDLHRCVLNLELGKDIEVSLQKIYQLVMSQRLLQDLHIDNLEQGEWMSLLLNVVDEIDALPK